MRPFFPEASVIRMVKSQKFSLMPCSSSLGCWPSCWPPSSSGVGCLKKRCECLRLFSLWALGLRTVRAVGVRRMLGRVGCYTACNWALSCRVRVNRRALVLLGGLLLLLHVVRTNDIVGYRLVIVCGLLNMLRCRYVLPRYDLTQLARAVALALGLCRCSFMSG